MTNADDRRRRLDLLAIALFGCVLLAPRVDELVRTDAERGPRPEQRAPAEKPPPATDVATLQAYPGLYESYYRDRLGLRDVLLGWHSYQKMFVFGVSPTPKVELGTDHWMYYTGERSIETFRGLNPVAPVELEHWRTELEREQRWLAARGIDWLFVLGPNKETIYPERLRPALNRVGPTRLEVIARGLSPGAGILELRPALTDAKRFDDTEGPLYYPLGTHWTGRGNYVVYREMIAALPAGLGAGPPIERTDVVFLEAGFESDSWARMMYLERTLPQAITYGARLSGATGRQTSEIETHYAIRRFENVDTRLPRALMFHDSFGAGLMGWLSEHFSVLTTVQGHVFDTDMILAEKPDVVLMVYVERVLSGVPPSFVGNHDADSDRLVFETARDVRFQLHAGREPPELSPLGATSVQPVRDEGANAIAIETSTPGDTVLLPPFEPGAGAHVLRIDVTAPHETYLDLFYQPAGESEWQQRNHVEVALPRGRSTAWCVLDAAPISGHLRIRPGREPGRYLVHALEVRAIGP